MAESPNSNKDTELTMCDVLQEEQELEEDANAVLGGSDDTNCSYDKGYVPRQALYACKTCSVNGEAGVCLACCYACHDGHEVVELYTKRNFRCDCGNSKFNDKTCTLRSEKEPINTKNRYNQNFNGLYCSCSRPYPDLEDNVSDEMIQCVLCEDWYHGRHLGVEIPDDYFEMICEKCMESHKFLYTYLNRYNIKVDDCGTPTKKSTSKPVNSLSDIKNSIKSDTTSSTNGVSPDVALPNSSMKSEIEVGVKDGSVTGSQKSASESDIVVASIKNEPSIKLEMNEASNLVVNEQVTILVKIENESSVQNGDVNDITKKDTDNCILKKLDSDLSVMRGSAFWPDNWRSELCHCADCMVIYNESECEFLLNPDDTIQAYEERGKGQSGESQYDQGLSALGQLDRVKQMEAVRAYTNMKGQLKEYLKEFADNKRTVCESDIKEFFERIGKKQKLNNGIPHFCR